MAYKDNFVQMVLDQRKSAKSVSFVDMIGADARRSAEQSNARFNSRLETGRHDGIQSVGESGTAYKQELKNLHGNRKGEEQFAKQNPNRAKSEHISFVDAFANRSPRSHSHSGFASTR